MCRNVFLNRFHIKFTSKILFIRFHTIESSVTPPVVVTQTKSSQLTKTLTAGNHEELTS